MYFEGSHIFLCQASLQGLPEILREVTVLSVYRHPHIVPLLSYSLSRHDGRQEACLVYPLMTRCGLDQALAARAQHWRDAAVRLRNAADVASGLTFLQAPGWGLHLCCTATSSAATCCSTGSCAPACRMWGLRGRSTGRR